MSMDLEGLGLPQALIDRAEPYSSPYAMRLAGVNIENNDSMVPTAAGLMLTAAGAIVEVGGRVITGRFNKTGLALAAVGLAATSYGCRRFRFGSQLINDSWKISFARYNKDYPDGRVPIIDDYME